MKATKMARGGFLLSGIVAAVVTLTACGTQTNNVNPDLLVKSNVDKIVTNPCSQTDTVELQKAVTFVDNAEGKQVSSILKRNEGDSLEPLKKALDDKLAVCLKKSTPVDELAKQACGQATVQACKTKGKEAFDSLPAERQGKTTVPDNPAAFNAELQGLQDKPEKLETATKLVNTLIGFTTAAKEGKPVANGGSSVDTAAIAAQIYGQFPDVTQKDVNVGSQGDHPVDWALNTQEERGSGSFATRTIKTAPEVGAYLNEDTDESKTAKAYVAKAITDAGYDDSEVNRALTGEGYFPVQLKDASQVLGTTYFKDGKVLVAGQWRQAAPGDVYWLFLASDGRLVAGALVRADCGNMDAKAIRIVRPGMPPAPPVEQPPGEETCPPGTVLNPETGVCEPPKSECKEKCATTTSPPPCATPPCSPSTTTTPPGNQKNAGEDSGPQGNAPVGNGQNQNSGSGDSPPHTPPPTEAYTAPPAHTQTQVAPPPVVQPTVNPGPTPTVNPPAEPPQTGELPGGPGCGHPDLC